MVMMNREDIHSAVDTLRLMMGARMPEEVKALKIAEDCMKLQLPQKPAIKLHTNRVPGEQEVPYCPHCNEVIQFIPIDKEKYAVTWCFQCGQALDWRSDD